jgi:YD repeat-containing protein
LSNNLVWRHFTFTPVTASAVRVVVKRALNMSSRITEVQAFQTAVAPDARFLSKRYFDCDSTGANCTLVRSIYQRFEQDGDTDPATSDGGQSNRRLASDSTQYNDDLVNGAPRFAAVNRSDFDGLGHYREVDTDGNFGSGDVKQTSTIFNPGSGTYPGSFTLPPANAVWFLHAAVRTRMVEGNTATVDEFCYDSTGFMSRTRRWASGNALGAQGATDVVTAMTNDGSGQAGTIRYFGGGFQPIATGDLCSLSLPSSDSYRIVQTFVGGVFQRSVFVDSSGSAVAPPSVDRDIDSGTGLVKVERDTTGLASTYSYDALGRRLSTQQDGALKITVSYVRATGPGGAGLTKAQVATAPDGAVLWQTGITYDSFGLKWREQRSTLTSGMASKYSLYSALDQLQSWSEFSTGSPKYTTVLSWDPFNRPKRIRPPEGAAHDVTYGYAGEFSVTRTAAMGTWYDGTTGQVLEYPRSKTDTYDRQHRRWRASVQGRIPSTTPDSAFVRQYDVGNRLATVSINGRVVASNSYDGNGNLTVSTDEWSQRSQSSFDALGLPHQRTSAGGVLSLDYDRAGRLIAVRNGSAILKDYQYSTSSTGNDRSLGRVTRARRFGQQPGGSPWTVSRTYTYAGTAGQISQVVTALFDGVHDEEFKQSYSYDAQGNVIDVGYPLEASLDAGSLGRDRHVVTSFSQRLPTSVQDVVSQRSTQPWITAAAYWPNSLPSSITAGNGVRTDISPDPFDVPRPAGVATSGVVTLYGQPDQNWSSGAFQYDGLGALVRVGSTYYLDAAGSSMEPDPGAPAPPAECDWTDEFGLDIAGLPDPSACQPLAFYYYDADDKLICIENRMADTRKWTFEGLDGRVLTEYVRKNTTRTWLRTDDSVYFRGDLIGSEHRGPGEPTTRKYIQQGFGASGIATDANGARAQ